MSRASQAKYKKLGLCIFCGKIPPLENVQACRACGIKNNEKQKKRREKFLELKICLCGNNQLVTKNHCANCRTKHNAGTKRRWAVVKNEVFESYGGYKCVCCNEKEKTFLSIDHINSDGAKHRKEIGSTLYHWLMKNKFPSGFQVLCMNCQWGKKNNSGICPHQSKKNKNAKNK